MFVSAQVHRRLEPTLALFALLLSACDESKSTQPSAPICTPTCDEQRCGEDDGCGTLCPCDEAGNGPKVPEVSCTPVCDGTRCDDGCGNPCACTQGSVCDADGACKASDVCDDTCELSGFECGQVCGKVCGQCAQDKTCVSGQCLAAESCDDCGLRLQVLSSEELDGDRRVVTVQAEYAPAEGEPRTRVADLRLTSSRKVQLWTLEPGPAVTEAKKSLYIDGATGNPWKAHGDGTFQILIHSFASDETLRPGILFTAKAVVAGPGAVAFSFARRTQTFAPTPADGALQRSGYDRGAVSP